VCAPFMFCYEGEALAHVALRERWEPEPGAPGLQRWDDLADVVADQAESRVTSVLLNHCRAQTKRWGHREAETFMSTRTGIP